MISKAFDPASIESSIYDAWEKSGGFQCQPKSQKKPYTIMMPPPNVTGNLHLGHALTYTLQDILIRFKRQRGFDTLWQPGTDHAGIATQMVVERQLKEEGLSRQELGREKFLERVWKWKAHSGDSIIQQQRRLGISPDWERHRFTMDEGLCKAVRRAFVQLYREGLIYRDKRLVNWDTTFQTAVSDVETVQKEIQGNLWYIRYSLKEEPTRFMVVATTRPETLFGDQAVAVHPEDERFKNLIGKEVCLPLTNRTIPVIGDTYCDPEKGSGAVKITPAHDFNDFEVGKRHNLPLLNIMDSLGRLTEAVPEAYVGLTAQEARKKVVADLEAQGLLEKIEPITHMVPHGDRSGVEIQPYLTDQWFLDAAQLAKPALEAVNEGKTSFVPSFWTSTYEEWLKNIQPWCISRQLWWGHQIPAWRAPDGSYIVAESEEEAQALALEKFGEEVTLTQDPDVLDTWFSSGIWPFSTLNWPGDQEVLARYYPTDVLCTGFDIIFFWVARMMMMGLHFMKEVPFKTVYIHALIRDEKGAKMSKSKGNVIDPLTLMDKFGTDALRYTLGNLAVPGRDIKLGESRVEGSRNFMTKIWNCARFLQMNDCFASGEFDPKSINLSVNKWIVGEIVTLAHSLEEALESYRFDEAGTGLYKFLWGTFCDYYLEFLKPIFNNKEDQSALKESQNTAGWVFCLFLRLANPFIPFITEELWKYFGDGSLLLTGSWPEFEGTSLINEAAREEMTWLVSLVDAVRSRRAEFNVPPAALIPLMFHEVTPEVAQRIHRNTLIIQKMTRVENVEIHEGQPAQVKGAIQFVVGSTTVVMPLANTVDLEKEVERLRREWEAHGETIRTLQVRLSNEAFRAKAKEEVIADCEERLSLALLAQEKIHLALSRLD